MLWLKAFHIMAVIAWFAGLFYLPRLFVYHADAKPGSELSETLKVMEYRLLTAIMTPAMAAVWILGLTARLLGGRLLRRLAARQARPGVPPVRLPGRAQPLDADFAADRNTRSAKFYRIANEVPTVFLIAIVLLVVLKPF